MKKLRKIGALLIALVMALSMSVTAFADSLVVNNTTDKIVTSSTTVTISDIPASASVSFSTYQVLYATYDETSNSLEYHLTDWAKQALVDSTLSADEPTNFKYMSEENAITALSAITAIATGQATTGSSATEQSELVNYLASYVAGLTTDVSYSVNWTDNTTFATADLPVGAFLVLPASDTMAFLNMLVSVDVSSTITDGSTAKNGWKLTANGAVLKGSEITIDKTVSDGTSSSDMVADGDTAQAQVGDTLYYSITVDVPKFAANSTGIVFTVTDTPTNVAIDLSSVVVTPYDASKVAGGALVAYSSDTSSLANTTYDYKATLDSNGVLTVDFSDKYLTTFYNASTGAYPYDYVIITYEAELLSSALVDEGNSNEAKLTYGNNTNSTNEDYDHTTVYTYQLELTKLGEDSSTSLSNASFKIYTDAAKTNALTFIKNNDGSYSVADSTDITDDTVTTYVEVTTGSNGTLILTGLDGSVTYYIEESVAPSGYTLNTNYLAFTITGATDSDSGDLTGAISSVSAIEYDSDGTMIESYPDTDETGAGSWTIKVNSDNTASINLTLTDTTIASLPSTGGRGTILFTILGCVIMISVAGLYIRYRRKVQG